MLSLILLCHAIRPAREPADLAALLRERAARSLASLVEASIAGVIADATLVAAPAPSLADVADEAGGRLVEAAEPRAALAQALAEARQTDVFLLSAGFLRRSRLRGRGGRRRGFRRAEDRAHVESPAGGPAHAPRAVARGAGGRACAKAAVSEAGVRRSRATCPPVARARNGLAREARRVSWRTARAAGRL